MLSLVVLRDSGVYIFVSVEYPERFLAASEDASSQRGQNVDANRGEGRGRSQAEKGGERQSGMAREAERDRKSESERDEHKTDEKKEEWKNEEAKASLLCETSADVPSTDESLNEIRDRRGWGDCIVCALFWVDQRHACRVRVAGERIEGCRLHCRHVLGGVFCDERTGPRRQRTPETVGLTPMPDAGSVHPKR